MCLIIFTRPPILLNLPLFPDHPTLCPLFIFGPTESTLYYLYILVYIYIASHWGMADLTRGHTLRKLTLPASKAVNCLWFLDCVELDAHHPSSCWNLSGSSMQRFCACCHICHVCPHVLCCAVPGKNCLLSAIHHSCLFQVFCPLIPWEDGVSSRCPFYGEALCSLLFSAPWPTESLCVSCCLLQVEASLMRVEKCVNLGA